MSREMVPEYWRNREMYLRPMGSVCKDCGSKYFPPRKICLKCGSKNLEKYELSEKGRVLSWTVVRYPSEEFSKYSPYVLGLIELDDGTRLVAQISDVSIDEMHIGMRVKMMIRRAFEEGESGIIRYVYKFVPDIKEK